MTQTDCPKFKEQHSLLIKSHGFKRISTTTELNKLEKSKDCNYSSLPLQRQHSLWSLCHQSSAHHAFKTGTKLTRIRIEYLEILTRKHSNESNEILQSTANTLIFVSVHKRKTTLKQSRQFSLIWVMTTKSFCFDSYLILHNFFAFPGWACSVKQQKFTHNFTILRQNLKV